MQKTLFPGPDPHVRGEYMLGPCLRAGCAHAAWAGDGSRSDDLGAGRRCLAPRVGGGRWKLVARDRAGLGGSQRVGEWWAGRCGVFPRCGVGHAWTLGLVRRPMALSGMLLWWPSGAFSSCCIGICYYVELIDTIFTDVEGVD
jgi:hypothetical protein